MKPRWEAVMALMLLPALLPQAQPSEQPAGKESQPQSQASGADLFQTHCARCHGADARGDTFIGRKWKIPNLGSSEVQQLSSEERIHIITKGKNRMPAHGKKLNPEEIKALDSYIQELGKKLEATPAK